MTPSHVARQLLRHGPLTFSEFREITGWPYSQCRNVLNYLAQKRGEFVSKDGRFYLLEQT